jgi:hypothetical protein
VDEPALQCHMTHNKVHPDTPVDGKDQESTSGDKGASNNDSDSANSIDDLIDANDYSDNSDKDKDKDEEDKEDEEEDDNDDIDICKEGWTLEGLQSLQSPQSRWTYSGRASRVGSGIRCPGQSSLLFGLVCTP